MHSMATIGNDTVLYVCLKVAGRIHLKYSQRTYTCAHTYRKLGDVIDVLTNLIMVIILQYTCSKSWHYTFLKIYFYLYIYFGCVGCLLWAFLQFWWAGSTL